MLSNRKDTSVDKWPRVAPPASDRADASLPPAVSQMGPLWLIYAHDRAMILIENKNNLVGIKVRQKKPHIFCFCQNAAADDGEVGAVQAPALHCSLCVCMENVGSTCSVCVRHL